MNFNKFTIKAREAVQAAIEHAQNENNQAVEPAHILLARLTDSENVTVGILQKIGASIPVLQEEIRKEISRFPVVKGASVSGKYLSGPSNELFERTQVEAYALNDEYISSEHIMLAMLEGTSETGRHVKSQGFTKHLRLDALLEVR